MCIYNIVFIVIGNSVLNDECQRSSLQFQFQTVTDVKECVDACKY